MLPTDDQLGEILQVKLEHTYFCDKLPTYDLSQHGRIRITCVCGWIYDVFQTEDE